MDDAPALPLGDGDEASDDETPCAAPGEPRTAEEFMRMMRRESRRMGDVFLAENEAERSANASVPGPAPAPSPRAPPAAWERSLLADLADARTRLDYHAARGVGSKKHARVAVPRSHHAAHPLQRRRVRHQLEPVRVRIHRHHHPLPAHPLRREQRLAPRRRAQIRHPLARLRAQQLHHREPTRSAHRKCCRGLEMRVPFRLARHRPLRVHSG